MKSDLLKKRLKITNTIKDILISRLNLDILPEEIPSDAILFGGGIGLDSIDALQLVVGIEAELGVLIPQNQFAILRSVDTVADYILQENNKISLEEPEFKFNDKTSIIQEDYEQVRTNVGLCMPKNLRVFKLFGNDALNVLNQSVTGKVEFLPENSILETLLLKDNGSINLHLVVANCGDYYLIICEHEDAANVNLVFTSYTCDVKIEDISNQFALIRFDGPKSSEVIEDIFGADVLGMTQNMIVPVENDERQLQVIRMAITGDIGYLVLVPDDYLNDFIYSIGKERELHFCKSDAYDLLRLEGYDFVKLNFIPHNESPLEANLHWMIDFRKDSFIGKQAILEKLKMPLSKKLMPFYSIDSREIAIGSKLTIEGRDIGYVTASAYSPAMKCIIGYAYVNIDFACPGCNIQIDSKENEQIILTTIPFFLSKSYFIYQ